VFTGNIYYGRELYLALSLNTKQSAVVEINEARESNAAATASELSPAFQGRGTDSPLTPPRSGHIVPATSFLAYRPTGVTTTRRRHVHFFLYRLTAERSIPCP
jgi:hypothetical protein